ncbi:MAG: pyridoxamine 5'-phosphate oxidase family protein [Gammaproteobacteria bacterium]|nr:pyridoxamine 5'-phosphate oxidase family protein [Gammaproteobacteria bacterium]
MTHAFADTMFTESVKTAQQAYGSREHNENLTQNFGPNNELRAREIDFIAKRDSFYLATVNETGWPYVQHRGGPPGFLKVTGSKQLAWADFRGNTQLVSVGNLSKNDRCSIILMDYAGRRRLKLIGHIRVVEAAEIEASILETVSQADYTAVIERVFLIELLAFDWNCPQHISRRYTKAEFEEQRVAQLAG